MFENKKTSQGIYYSSYIASWYNTGMLKKYGLSDEFRNWLWSEGLTNNEVAEISNLVDCGKFELECDIKEFMKKYEPHVIDSSEFGRDPAIGTVNLFYNLTDESIYDIYGDLTANKLDDYIKYEYLMDAGDIVYIRNPINQIDVKIVAVEHYIDIFKE